MAGAPDGNKNAMKFDTPEKRQAACQQLCDHIRSGLSWESNPVADPQTLRRYVEDFPIDFDIDKIADAERSGRRLWEAMGMNGIMGKTKGFNAPTWIFNMKNRYKWKDINTFANDTDNPLPSNTHLTTEEAARAYAETMRDARPKSE